LKFGLFGAPGARRPGRGQRGLPRFHQYVGGRRGARFSSVFLVEHHFTGFGQVSASLNLLSYLAAPHREDPPRHRGRRPALAQSGTGRRRGGHPRSSVKRPARFRRRQGLSPLRILPASACPRRRRPRASTRRSRSSARRGPARAGSPMTANGGITTTSSSSRRRSSRPHPPLWMAPAAPTRFRRAAREGYNLLLDQIAPIDVDHRAGAHLREECQRASAGPTTR